MKKNILWLFLFMALTGLNAQITELSEKARISILSCGPGDELNSRFGHTAIRIQDITVLKDTIDWVYNFGTFDFNTPNFYLKFTRGKLPYSLSRYPFRNFLYAYQYERRWVKEQWLALNPEQKNELFQILERHYQPENREYKYDFLFENCATKIPEVLQQALGNNLDFKYNHLQDDKSFRELIHENLYWNTWANFGIDLALGAVVDQKAEPFQFQFLPEYVFQQMSHTSLSNKPLVSNERVILEVMPRSKTGYFAASPLFWFLMFGLFVLAITYVDFANQTRNRWLDFGLLFISGIAGLFLIFLWFFTDHTATAWNMNILWALPLNAVLAFYFLKDIRKINWTPKALVILIALILLTGILWISGIQVFSPVLGVILPVLTLRYLYLWYYLKLKA